MINTIPESFYNISGYNKKRYLVLCRLLELINDALSMNDIIQIEISCFNISIEEATKKNIKKIWENESFQRVYSRHTTRVIGIFDIPIVNESNIINRIKNNTIEISSLVNLVYSDICPDKYQKHVEMINERKNITIKMRKSTMYKCPVCGHRETTIRQIQFKRMDEGSNTKATCLYCPHEWVVN